MTHPDPHASYREHVSSEAEAVEEAVPKPHRGKYTLIEVTELVSLRAQLATARKALEDMLEFCQTQGDFKNGVTHNGIDEGEVWASGVFDNASAALNSGEQKQSTVDDWPYPTIDPTCAQDLK